MRKLLPLLLLWACSPAFATLSYVNGAYETGNPAGTCTISSTLGVGQVIVAIAKGGSLSSSSTVSDSVDTGNYTLITSAGSGHQWMWWITTNASSSSYVVTLGTQGGSTVYWKCFAITGFVGTPTLDSAILNTATGSGTTMAINATSNFNTEFLFVNAFNDTSGTSTPGSATGWTQLPGAFSMGYYAYEATSGTVNNLSASLSPTNTWYLQLAGIYDNTGAKPSFVISNGHALMSNGKPVVIN
jgi:hypothetical protein